MAYIKIIDEICKGCSLCVRACPKKLLRLSETRINSKGYHPAESVNQDACVACKSCALTCPDTCIEVDK